MTGIDLERVLWPASLAGEAIAALAARSALGGRPAVPPPAPPGLDLADPSARADWLEATAAHLGVDVEPVDATYARAADAVPSDEDPLLVFESAEAAAGLAPRFFAVLAGSSRGDRATVLAPDGATHAIPAAAVRAPLTAPLDRPFRAYVERVLDKTGLAGGERAAAASAVLRAQLGDLRLAGAFALRAAAGGSVAAAARRERLSGKAAAMAAAHAAQFLLVIASWWVIGRGALTARFDLASFAAWGLLLFSLVPLRMTAALAQGFFAIGAGALLKRRLLAGALRLEPEEVRSEGSGRMLGRVIESQAVEALALGGGFLGLISIVELVIAAGVVAAGAGGSAILALMALGLALLAVPAIRFARRQRAWTRERIDMTHDLVERMAGHRTRLAQEARERWHAGEDEALERYAAVSAGMDRGAVELSLMPRAFLVAGLCGLVPAYVAGGASPGALATAIGGLLLVSGAFSRLVGSFSQLAGAAIAWKEVAPLWRAAARPEIAGSPAARVRARRPADEPAGGRGKPLLDASGVVFRYRPGGDPVLRGAAIRIDSGDRALLTGPSGSGKSTLASLLSGWRTPESGLVLLAGLDRHTLGSEGWRRRVAAAPQFHENHVFTGTLAFNLLLGRRWPAEPGDLMEAEEVCRDLGLGDLLDRMPGGLEQIVGESGWQLSHGERSRVFVARALLQRADLVILDESFAALDPETLRRCVRCVARRAPALLLIAHP